MSFPNRELTLRFFLKIEGFEESDSAQSSSTLQSIAASERENDDFG